MLEGRNVVVGVCGSIAAVRCVELIHELRRMGASVRVVASPASTGIINPQSLAFAAGSPVIDSLTGSVEHVDLCGSDGWGDVLLLAPATANTIGKMAAAIDDTPVTTCATTALGASMPVVIAPAMHEPMWDHPGVLRAIEDLEEWGVAFVPPRIEEGKAKIAENDAIATAVARAVTTQSLAGTSIVVTSGPTTEAIDSVRILTNRSSGRMGRAVARACFVRGASVTLLHDGPDVHYATVERVKTGEEMRERAVKHTRTADALVSAAAIGDFTVGQIDGKLDSSESHTITLEPAPKLLDIVRENRPELPIVGFKAEVGANDEALTAAARSQIDRMEAMFVVANDASVMGSSEARVLIVDRTDATAVAGSKRVVADTIIERLADALPETNG